MRRLILGYYRTQKAFADASGLTETKVSRAIRPETTSEDALQEVATKLRELQGENGLVIPDPIPKDAAVVIWHPEGDKVWVTAKLTLEVTVHNPVYLPGGDILSGFDLGAKGH